MLHATLHLHKRFGPITYKPYNPFCKHLRHAHFYYKCPCMGTQQILPHTSQVFSGWKQVLWNKITSNLPRRWDWRWTSYTSSSRGSLLPCCTSWILKGTQRIDPGKRPRICCLWVSCTCCWSCLLRWRQLPLQPDPAVRFCVAPWNRRMRRQWSRGRQTGGQTWRLEQNQSHGYLLRGYGEWLTPHCWTSPCSRAAASDEGLPDAQSTIVSEMTGQNNPPQISTASHKKRSKPHRNTTASTCKHTAEPSNSG